MKSKVTILAATAIASLNSMNIQAEEVQQVKCYCLAEAGANDCASADGIHSCAGQATEDFNCQEWKLKPEEECLDEDGLLEPKAGYKQVPTIKTEPNNKVLNSKPE